MPQLAMLCSEAPWRYTMAHHVDEQLVLEHQEVVLLVQLVLRPRLSTQV